MVDLRHRFGRLVKAHRQRLGITQEALAERAGISVDMVSKIEGMSTGARFRVVEELAKALNVDPAELFTTELPAGQLKRGPLVDITTRISSLSDGELAWLSRLIDIALEAKVS